MKQTQTPKNGTLTKASQCLRREMVETERELWYRFLKKLPITINRQKVIGKYIVDFYCDKAKLVIELDGFMHYEGDSVERDRERDEYLRSHGLTVVRYSNRELRKHFKKVCNDIWSKLEPYIE